MTASLERQAVGCLPAPGPCAWEGKIRAQEVEFLAAGGSMISSDSVTEGLLAYVPQVRVPQTLLVYHFQKYVASFHQIFHDHLTQ